MLPRPSLTRRLRMLATAGAFLLLARGVPLAARAGHDPEQPLAETVTAKGRVGAKIIVVAGSAVGRDG